MNTVNSILILFNTSIVSQSQYFYNPSGAVIIQRNEQHCSVFSSVSTFDLDGSHLSKEIPSNTSLRVVYTTEVAP